MLGIVCVMICNLSSANFKVAIRRGLFGRLSVLIRRIRILEALDWDPRCFPVLDGLYLASSVVSFSATASCEFGFNLSKSSRTICFSSLRLMWFVPNCTFIIQPSEWNSHEWLIVWQVSSLMTTKALEEGSSNSIQIRTNGKAPTMYVCSLKIIKKKTLVL